ncbi:hydroxyacid dehydrogenase, partial [bacterium]
MTVLVADKLEASALDGLRALGVDLLDQPTLTADDLPAALRETGADLLIVRSTRVTAEALGSGRLGAVVRAGAGYDTIDVDAASRQGVLVANTPGRNAQAVAELAWGLILACDRRIPDGVLALREGRWDKREFSRARGLAGRTLGLIGMGKIGQEMATRAKAFGMHVVALSRWLTPEVAAALGIGRAEDLSELAQLSD